MNPPTRDRPSGEHRDAACTASPDCALPSLSRAGWAARLRRHLTVASIAKVAMLVLLYVLFFPAQQRPHIDPAKVASHLLSPR